MLYVFHVEPGTMLTFDISLTFGSVENLKQSVEQKANIPASKQVFLVSGGQTLDDKDTICSYTAGTDTNPIFLFSKYTVDGTTAPPAASVSIGCDIDFHRLEQDAQRLPVSYNTIVQRTQLAVQMHEAGQDILKTCKALVLDQHLQQQGWASVVASFDDLCVLFKRKANMCIKSFNEYLDEHGFLLQHLDHFDNDLKLLSKIPIIAPLRDNLHLPRRSEESDYALSSESPITLLEWISRMDNTSRMDQLFDHCKRGLQQFGQPLITSITTEVTTAIETSCKEDMKEIKGLGHRLYGLETLLNEANDLVQEQQKLMQSFQQNLNRATNVRDDSVLPDLCNSHQKQLGVMLSNHEKLRDIKRRCIKAKTELTGTITLRLVWVSHVQSSIAVSDQRLCFYHESLKRLRQHLEIMKQIHLAPSTYMSALAEVVRRRYFSQTFLLWASDLACHLLTIYNDEVTRRKDFSSQFGDHFLSTLFPGMNDLPPSFATQPPSVFDTSLPPVSSADVSQLQADLDLLAKSGIPEMAELVRLLAEAESNNELHLSALEQLTSTKVRGRSENEQVGDTQSEAIALEDQDVENKGAVEQSSNTTLLPGAVVHLREWERGCESETDTEEFEKLCQSPLDINDDAAHQSSSSSSRKPTTSSSSAATTTTAVRPGTRDATTETEDNLHSSRLEHERLRNIIIQMGHISHKSFCHLRQELNQLREIHQSSKTLFDNNVESLSSSWENLSQDREVIANELDAARLRVTKLTAELTSVRLQKATLEKQVDDKASEQVQFQDDLLRAKQAEVDDVRKKLMMEHKAALENMRARHRLMSDKSDQSDESLAKLKQRLEEEKETAIVEAVLVESQKWQTKVNEVQQQLDSSVEAAVQRVTEAKDKQIRSMLERENSLQLEYAKQRQTLKQLAESDVQLELNELRVEIERMRQELDEKRQQRKAVTASEGTAAGSDEDGEGKTANVATSPIRSITMSSSISAKGTIIRPPRVSIDSCHDGAVVLVLWDPKYQSYCILQTNTEYPYFLHCDSLEKLGLPSRASAAICAESSLFESNEASTQTAPENRKMFCLAEVTDRQHCHARKKSNRYHVPMGTKFYRVFAKPVSWTAPSSRPGTGIGGRHFHASGAPMSQSHTDPATPLAAFDKPDSAIIVCTSGAPHASGTIPMTQSLNTILRTRVAETIVATSAALAGTSSGAVIVPATSTADDLGSFEEDAGGDTMAASSNR